MQVLRMDQIENQSQMILDSIADGILAIDSDWKIISFNRAAEKITGIRKDEAMGRHCWEVLKSDICQRRCPMRQTMDSGKPVVNQPVHIINPKGKRVKVSISAALLKDQGGKVIGGVETFHDLGVVEKTPREPAGQHSFMDIISKSREMHRLFEILELVSKDDTTILLEGESGTGKELFARAIHFLSHRKKGPMITVNCAALPDTLLESELFGYKAGAFTDAKRDKPGRLALAQHGSLFLDEIGDISPLLQVKLLRVIEEKVYEPLGSTKSEKADVRIVVSTNKDLGQLAHQGLFREDLYYRINIVKIILPPLRRRREDIPLLVDHFIEKFNNMKSKDIHSISSEAMDLLMCYDFPGNIRELENIIEYATLVCQSRVIGIEHLPESFRQESDRRMKLTSRGGSAKESSLDDLEKDFLYEVLRKNNWKRKLTADQMGIHPTTLWRKMKRLHVEPPKGHGRPARQGS